MSAQAVEWYDPVTAKEGAESKAGIVQVFYFNGFGRASPIDFIL
jgi:hypothetical protein